MQGIYYMYFHFHFSLRQTFLCSWGPLPLITAMVRSPSPLPSPPLPSPFSSPPLSLLLPSPLPSPPLPSSTLVLSVSPVIVSTHTHMHTYTLTHSHNYTHAHSHNHTLTHMHTHTLTHMHTHTITHSHNHTHAHLHTCTLTHSHNHTLTQVLWSSTRLLLAGTAFLHLFLERTQRTSSGTPVRETPMCAYLDTTLISTFLEFQDLGVLHILP